MMKKFFLLALALLPALAWGGDNSVTDLNPVATDVSVTYLGTIFGVVDEVLHGTGSQILGAMFGVFNSVVLIFAGLLWSYATFVGMINTASEGEFLGRKWSSMWVPLRMVAGAALLYPKASGYSTIQVIVMYLVVQGVGAADKVWNVALDYLDRKGALFEPVQSVTGKTGGQDNSFLVGKAGTILKSEICALSLYNALRNQKGDGSAGSLVPDFASSFLNITGKGPNGQDTGKPIDYAVDKGGYIYFPSTAPYRGVCGKVSWNFISREKKGHISDLSTLELGDSTSIGVRQMVLDLQPMAGSIADLLIPPKKPSAFQGDKGGSGQSVEPSDPGARITDQLTAGELLGAASDYFAIIKPALRQQAGSVSEDATNFIKDAKATGWIMAGAYYYNLAKLNQAIRGISLPKVANDIDTSFQPNYEAAPFKDLLDQTGVATLKKKLPPNGGGIIDNYIKKEIDDSSKNDPNANKYLYQGPNAGGGDIDKALGKIRSAVSGPERAFEQALQKAIDDDSRDPILQLISIGNARITTVVQAIEATIGIVLGVSVGLSIAGAAASFFVPAAPIILSLFVALVMVLVMPILFLWAGINFTIGATLVYYVPAIPFLLFLFGATTWFAMVVEAMIAAPLVAVGITHPDGHDFLGKAEQSVMLWAGVTLRPVLMVFGFIFGIILSFVSISLLNHMFGLATKFVADFGIGQGADMGGLIAVLITNTVMLILYTTTLLTVINRCFSMIYEVPNKVLRWIGGHAESTFEESGLQQVKGRVDQGADQLVGTGRSIAQSGVEQGKGIGENLGKAGGQKANQWLEDRQKKDIPMKVGD